MAPRPPSPPLAANYLSARDDSSDWASAFTLLGATTLPHAGPNVMADHPLLRYPRDLF
jgi:hypothetical protein